MRRADKSIEITTQSGVSGISRERAHPDVAKDKGVAVIKKRYLRKISIFRRENARRAIPDRLFQKA
jgi:hypothetical protein